MGRERAEGQHRVHRRRPLQLRVLERRQEKGQDALRLVAARRRAARGHLQHQQQLLDRLQATKSAFSAAAAQSGACSAFNSAVATPSTMFADAIECNGCTKHSKAGSAGLHLAHDVLGGGGCALVEQHRQRAAVAIALALREGRPGSRGQLAGLQTYRACHQRPSSHRTMSGKRRHL